MIYILKNIGKGKIGVGERQITKENLFRIDTDPTKDTNIYIRDFLFSDGIMTLQRTDGVNLTQDLDGRYLRTFTELDPTVPQYVKNITLNNISNWNAGFYDDIISLNLENIDSTLKLTLNQRSGDSITGQLSLGNIVTNITQIANRSYNDLHDLPILNISDWNTAFGWGDHSTQGYITGVNNITDIPNRSYNDLQDLPDINALVEVVDTNVSLDKKEIATVGGNSISETITKLNQPVLNGNILTLSFLNEEDVEQSVSVDLSSVVSTNSGISNATYNASTNIITLQEEDGDTFTIDLSEFSIITTTDEFGVTTLTQEGVEKLRQSKVGRTGKFSDLLFKPTTIAGYGITNAYTKPEINAFFNGTIPISGYNKSNWDTAYGWGNHADVGYLTEYQNLSWDLTSGNLTISNGNTINIDGRYAQTSQLKNLAFTGLSIRDVNDVEQFNSTTYMRFDGVTFDAENHLITVEETPPQTLVWNGLVNGEITISDGNTIDLDDRYSRNPFGREGQIYYIDEDGTNNIEPDFLMKRGIVVESQEEFDLAAIEGFSLEEVFNSWQMFSHYYGEDTQSQSPPSFPALNENDPQESTRLTSTEFYGKTAWGYDAVNERIYLNKNYHPYTGFISPKKYSNYTLGATFSSPNNDDDQIGLIIGFYKDPNTGFEYTLSVIRELVEASGQGTTTYKLVYNMGQNPVDSTNHDPNYIDNSETIIVDGTDLAPFPEGATGWVGNNTRVFVERTNDVYSIKTSQFGGAVIDDTTEILIDLNNYPELSMFMGASNIGFSAKSQQDAYFSNIEFSGFVDYIFWDQEDDTYDTWEFDQDTETYFLQDPKTVFARDYFGVGRFIESYLFGKTYYVNENDRLIKVGGGRNITKVTDLENDAEYISGFTVLDKDGNEQFEVTDGVRFEGVEFDSVNKKVMVTKDPLVADTVFVHSSLGDDTTGVIENRNKPFRTFEAANNAIPNGQISYTIWILSSLTINSIIRDNGSSLELTIRYDGTGILNFSNCSNISGGGIHRGPLKIVAPRATFTHINPTQGGFGASLTLLEMEFKHMNIGSHNSHSGFLTGRPDTQEYCIVKCRTMTLSDSVRSLCSFNGTLIVTELLTIDPEVGNYSSLTGNGAKQIYFDIKQIQKNNGSTVFTVFQGNRHSGNKMKISNISGEGSLLFLNSYGGGAELDFDGLVISPEMTVSLTNGFSGSLTITGICDDNNPPMIFRSHSGKTNFFNFKGRMDYIQPSNPNIEYRFNNAYITCTSSLFTGDNQKSLVRFDNHNTIIIEDKSPIIVDNSITQDIIVNGTIKTNSISMGTNVNVINKAYTFKEKSKEIVVRSKWELINKELDSDTIYVSDGDLGLDNGDHIIVPPGGLSVMGYSFDASRLGSYGKPHHSIFKSLATLSFIDEVGLRTIKYPKCENVITPEMGRSLYFSGSPTNVKTGIDDFNYFFMDNQNPFSIGIWFKSENVKNYDSILLCRGRSYNSANISLYLTRNSGDLNIYVRGAYTTIASDVVDGEWHYCEIRWDGINATSFFDGTISPINVGSNGNQGVSWQMYEGIILGANGNKNGVQGNYYEGYIKTLLIYPRGRTDNESIATYNNGLGQPFANEPNDVFTYLTAKDEPTTNELLTTGSGNIVIHNIAFTTTGDNSGVFDCVDVDGSHALEMITVNFEGCNNLGRLKNYRQGTGITIGLYGCGDGLILDGQWNGFKLTNTNAFGFGANGTMFKRGDNLTFNNRFYLEINVDLQNTATICDFGPENFNDNKLLQVNTTLAKIGGQINPELATPQFFPNITPMDPQALFVDNIGLANSPTTPYGFDLNKLSIYSDDDEAIANGLQNGYAYINSSTGNIKKVGIGDGGASSGDIGDINQDNYYTFQQSTASSEWIINHNLNKRPSVTVKNSNDDTLWGDVKYDDNNTLRILFNKPYSGRAELN